MVRIPYDIKELVLENTAGIDVMTPGVLALNKIGSVGLQREIIRKALGSPLERPSLQGWIRKGDGVVIIVPDITRRCASEVYLPIVSEILEKKGLSGDNVKIIIATGNHRGNTECEIKKITSDMIYGQYAVFNHESDNDLKYMGRTASGNDIYINRIVAEADKIILTGACSYHTFAGFSGGRKALLPGVSGRQTILYNHKLMIDGERINPLTYTGILDGNPVHKDMTDAMGVIGTERIFMLNTISNVYGETVAARSGSPVTAFYSACDYIKSTFPASANKKYDIVICGCGGFPYDISFYQSFRGVCTGAGILKNNGVLILIAGLAEGFGEDKDKFVYWYSKDTKSIIKALKKDFDVVGRNAYDTNGLTEKGCKFYLVSDDAEEIAKTSGAHIIPSSGFNTAVSKIIEDYKIKVANPDICVIPYGNVPVFLQ